MFSHHLSQGSIVKPVHRWTLISKLPEVNEYLKASLWRGRRHTIAMAILYFIMFVNHHRILNPKAYKSTSLGSTAFDQWSAVSRASCRNFYCVFLSLHLWQVQWTSEARASAATHFSYWCQLLLSLSSRRMSGKMFFFPWFPAWKNHYTLHKTKKEKVKQEQTQKNNHKNVMN